MQATTLWETYRAEFPIFRSKTYFNTCSLGALSTRVAAAIQSFIHQWDASGASAWYGPWWEEIAALRGRFAAVIGARPDEIALFPSVTAALTAVSSAFAYRERPGVVLSDLEFPTTVYQWSVKSGAGVELTMLTSPDRLTVPLDLYERAVDGRTQLVVASHVYFTSGAIQDIAAVAHLAHARGAYCLVDAYQSVGQLPVDVHAAGVDFLISGGLKWLLGGPGIAYLYVRDDVAARLRPLDVGWFAHRDQFAFDVRRFEYADGARRFEGGTPSVAATYAGRAGLDIVLEIEPTALRERQVELVRHVVESAQHRGLAPRVPGRVENLAGIVTIPRADPQAVVRGLSERGIIVDSRPGVIRLSPYFYNLPEECDRVVDAIMDLERSGVR
ncbi:MAG TPA: aminotransferase class V-fold PLP-dependent enzyme [bacterium]|nr:aminotransferase class V-fold PLP-dependent enzyme [bacterium]